MKVKDWKNGQKVFYWNTTDKKFVECKVRKMNENVIEIVHPTGYGGHFLKTNTDIIDVSDKNVDIYNLFFAYYADTKDAIKTAFTNDQQVLMCGFKNYLYTFSNDEE